MDKSIMQRIEIRHAAISLIFFASISATAQTQDQIYLNFIALDGREINTKTLKGNIVLIDCWATWCGPCIKELQHIKALYEKYNDKGFEVIGISMDDAGSKERVQQILKIKNITWPQRFEGKGFNDDSFVKQYNVKSLPAVYLLDKEGNILHANARGELLESLIRKYLEQ